MSCWQPHLVYMQAQQFQLNLNVVKCAVLQVLAFSATYTPGLLQHAEALMHNPQHVMLAAETVSLIGVRQFYMPIAGNLCISPGHATLMPYGACLHKC